MKSDYIEVYTDGACRNNPGPGGWGVIIKKDGRTFELGGYEEETTNNIMEMTAAIEALVEIGDDPRPVKLYTDSSYLRDGITKWIHNWKINGWKKKDKKPVLNQEYWMELDELNRVEVEWNWVKGHNGHPLNERADEIATSFSRGEPVELTYEAVPDENDEIDESDETEVIQQAPIEKPDLQESEISLSVEKEEPEITVSAKPDIHNENVILISIAEALKDKFIETLKKKGFMTSEITEETVIGKNSFKPSSSCSKDGLIIDVSENALFLFRGILDREAEELAASIAEADSRYADKVLKGTPVDFPEDLTVWEHRHLYSFMRPFFKNMVSKWKFEFKEGFIEIFDTRNRDDSFSINLEEKFSWRDVPDAKIWHRIREGAAGTSVFEDRFFVSFAGDLTKGITVTLIPGSGININMALSRPWNEIDNCYDAVNGWERFRIKSILKKMTGTKTLTVTETDDQERAAREIAGFIHREIKAFLDSRFNGKFRYAADVIVNFESPMELLPDLPEYISNPLYILRQAHEELENAVMNLSEFRCKRQM